MSSMHRNDLLSICRAFETVNQPERPIDNERIEVSLMKWIDSVQNTIDTLETSSILEWKQDLQKKSGVTDQPLGSNIVKLNPQDR